MSARDDTRTQVAAKYQWSPLETLEQLVRKAGYDGPVDQTLLDAIELVSYESTLHSTGFAEFLELTGLGKVRAGFFSAGGKKKEGSRGIKNFFFAN